MGDLVRDALQLAAELRYDVGQFPHAGTNQRYARAAELLERLADQQRGAVEAERDRVRHAIDAIEREQFYDGMACGDFKMALDAVRAALGGQ